MIDSRTKIRKTKKKMRKKQKDPSKKDETKTKVSNNDTNYFYNSDILKLLRHTSLH